MWRINRMVIEINRDMKKLFTDICLLPCVLGTIWIPYMGSEFTTFPIWLLTLTGAIGFVWVLIIYYRLQKIFSNDRTN